jgi:hypothetical protein
VVYPASFSSFRHCHQQFSISTIEENTATIKKIHLSAR